MKDNQLRRVMDTYLPGVENPGFEQQVWRRIRARGHRKLPRRGLVLAAVLIILLVTSATAVAAVLLTGRQVVEDYALPMASGVPGDAYTMEQTRTLLALAKENGLILSENTLAQLDAAFAKGEGYYKEEMIMAIAKAAFGPAPAAWTLEQQNWFDDACVAIGFIPQKEKALPEKGEDGRAWAIALAQAHLAEAYGEKADLQDPARYDPAGVQYISGDADGEYPGMYWSVCFQPRKGTAAALDAAEYWVYLNDDGEVLGDVRRPGAEPGVHTMWVTDAYRRCYGDREGWSQAVHRAYRAAMLQCIQTPEDKDTLLCLELSSYPDIAENALSREEASQRALSALGREGASVQAAYYLGASPNPIWRAVMHFPDGSRHAAEVDSVTGEILLIEPCTVQEAPFLQRTLDEAGQRYREYLETVPGFG